MFYFGCVVSVWFELVASSARAGGCLVGGCDGKGGWGKRKVEREKWKVGGEWKGKAGGGGGQQKVGGRAAVLSTALKRHPPLGGGGELRTGNGWPCAGAESRTSLEGGMR